MQRFKLSELPPVVTDDGGLWSGIDGRDGRDGKDGRDGVGKDGRDGDDGKDADSFRLRGEWSAKRQYEPLDVVTHEGSSWSCVGPNKNREPIDGSRYWQLLAAKGKSIKGDKGDPGGRGPGSGRLNQLEERVEQLEAGIQTTLAGLADVDLIVGNAVRVTATGVALATAASGEVVGLAASDANAGQPLAYLTEGQVSRLDWTPIIGTADLIPNSTYYLSSTAGRLSTNPPSSGYVVRVATALDERTLDIEVSQSVLL